MSLDKHNNPSEWDGVNRRQQDHDWIYYRREVMSGLAETKDDVANLKKDFMDLRLLMVEMRTELKLIVNKSSAITSFIVSTAVAALGTLAGYFIQK